MAGKSAARGTNCCMSSPKVVNVELLKGEALRLRLGFADLTFNASPPGPKNELTCFARLRASARGAAPTTSTAHIRRHSMLFPFMVISIRFSALEVWFLSVLAGRPQRTPPCDRIILE